MTTLNPLLLFDLDGTLVETAPDLVTALNKITALEGVPKLPMDEVRHIVGRGSRYMLEQCFARYGVQVSEQRMSELTVLYMEEYGRHIADHSHVFPGLLDEMAVLQQAGWSFAVCTNKPEHLSLKLLEALEVDHWFDAICGADTFAGSKPDPRHINGTIERANGDPSRAIMIGDSETDIQAARAINIPVIAVDFGYTPVPVDQLGPDVIISDFSALKPAVNSFNLL